MINKYHKAKTGKIDFPEFLDMMSPLMALKDPKEEMEYAYQNFFVDERTGKMTFETLKKVC